MSSAERNVIRLFATRGLRGFADGAVSVLLAKHLANIGLSDVQIGALVTATLLGSAALTLSAGMWGSRLTHRTVLLASSAIMFATGLGFLTLRDFWPLTAVAVIGTLNPSAGDVSVFLPTEQAALSELASSDRTHAFARYNVCGNVAAGFGALSSHGLERLATTLGMLPAHAARAAFVIYAATAVVVALIYLGLPKQLASHVAPRAPLQKSRTVVLKLAALFSLDSLGGGFAIQSLLALWLFRRFDLSVAQAGAVFFATSMVAAFSQLLSSRLASRIGLVQTMVFTHLPANAFLVLAAFMPTAGLAITLLVLRMCFAQMDVPARQAYVMSVVPPEERAAAASVTNVPRSLASAATPFVAGWLLSQTSFGWPLVLGGAIKIVYDLLLLAMFRAHRPTT